MDAILRRTPLAIMGNCATECKNKRVAIATRLFLDIYPQLEVPTYFDDVVVAPLRLEQAH